MVWVKITVELGRVDLLGIDLLGEGLREDTGVVVRRSMLLVQ